MLTLHDPRPARNCQGFHRRDFLRIGAGFTHACALRRNGRVKCWGAIRTFPDVAE